uniref:Uncharacterized protein n=1 Tax=viral metagenome TaxID=1070528 RepID=A0A6C0AZK9_9ZZZZ
MSRFNTSTNHPLIPNANEYMYDRQFVSIHSEDRNILKYPNSSEFEIELPQDYCNVQAVRLDSWTFPANYNVFSLEQNNISIVFEITKPYNPTDYYITDPLMIAVSDALFAYIGNPFISIIGEGFYNPFQIATELTNRMNNTVSIIVQNYLQKNHPDLVEEFSKTGYNQFVVVYNEVGQKLWFGNKSSDFIISNDSSVYLNSVLTNAICFRQQYPCFTNWGLPAYLGFTRCPGTTTPSINGSYPRFFYGNVSPGDNGFWLLPDEAYLGTSSSIPVYYLEAPYKINLMGYAYFYIEIDGMNSIDETLPYAVNNFTTTTNGTAAVVKSAFAKIAVTTTPVAQWFDNDASPMKVYNPPAERISKLKIKIRYHNGLLVQFNKFDYSIMLEFVIFRPQQNRKISNLMVPGEYS